MLRSFATRSSGPITQQLLVKKLPRGSIMSFHFASTEYTKCFQDLPPADTAKIREQAIKYLETFDEKEWFDDPVCHLWMFCSRAKRLFDDQLIIF